MRPYPSYISSNVEWLNEVPKGWSVERIRRRVRLRTDKAIGSQRKVALENIESWTGRFLEVENADYSGEGVEFFDGDVLFGKLRPYLAKAWLADFDGAAVGDFHVYELSQTLNGHFFQYLVLSGVFISVVDGSTYGAKMPRASWDFIGNLVETFPPFKEQQQIADYLDVQTAKIDALIDKQQQLIETLAERRQAVISHAVTKGLDPTVPMKDSGVEWLGHVPASWSVQRMKRLGKTQIGLTYDPSDVVDEDEGTLVLRSGNVQHGHIRLDDVVYVRTAIPPSLVTQVGDILICARNGSRNLIGKNAQISSGIAGASFGAFMSVLRSSIGDYLLLVLNSTIFKHQMGSFVTATINQLTNATLNNFEIPVPLRDEQLRIIRYLEREAAQIDALSAKADELIGVLKERRQALISAAVTGKIDVRGRC